MNSMSPTSNMTPLKQRTAQNLIMNDMSFIQRLQQNENSYGQPQKKSRQGHSAFGIYTQEQVLPLVQREVSTLAKQRIKVRGPTDFLKIQQRVKTDLEGLNHSNAFFKQRYSNYVNSIEQTDNSSRSPQRAISSQQCYRPRPFIDHRSNCLANYDEYLLMRELDRQKQSDLKNCLAEQISNKKNTVSQEKLSTVELEEPSITVNYIKEQAQRELSKRHISTERRQQQQIVRQRLQAQQEMKRQIDIMQPSQDENNAYIIKTMDQRNVDEYQSYLQSRKIKLRYQQGQRNEYQMSDRKHSLKNLLTVSTPLKRGQEDGVDFDLNKGILSHFFRREVNPNIDNKGKDYTDNALKKQQNFDKVFLKLLIAGEQAKLDRLNRRSSSVARR